MIKLLHLWPVRWRFSRIGIFIILSAIVHMALLFLNFSNRISPSDNKAKTITVFLEDTGTAANSTIRRIETAPVLVNKIVKEQPQHKTLSFKHATNHSQRRKPTISKTLLLSQSVPPETLLQPQSSVPVALPAPPDTPMDHSDEYGQQGAMRSSEMQNIEFVTVVGILVSKDGIVEQAYVLEGTGNTMLNLAAIQLIKLKSDFNLPSDGKYPIDMIFIVHHRYIGNQLITYIPTPSLLEWPFK